MTKEQIERIAANCGVVVSYAEVGKGGFIVDSTNIKYESLTDIVMDYFGTSNENRKKYSIFDENMFLAGLSSKVCKFFFTPLSAA